MHDQQVVERVAVLGTAGLPAELSTAEQQPGGVAATALLLPARSGQGGFVSSSSRARQGMLMLLSSAHAASRVW
jgi:hypothetical protein